MFSSINGINIYDHNNALLLLLFLTICRHREQGTHRLMCIYPPFENRETRSHDVKVPGAQGKSSGMMTIFTVAMWAGLATILPGRNLWDIKVHQPPQWRIQGEARVHAPPPPPPTWENWRCLPDGGGGCDFSNFGGPTKN